MSNDTSGEDRAVHYHYHYYGYSQPPGPGSAMTSDPGSDNVYRMPPGAAAGPDAGSGPAAQNLHRHPSADALIKGLLVGAGAAYLLTNETAQRTIMRSAVQVWAVLARRRGGDEGAPAGRRSRGRSGCNHEDRGTVSGRVVCRTAACFPIGRTVRRTAAADGPDGSIMHRTAGLRGLTGPVVHIAHELPTRLRLQFDTRSQRSGAGRGSCPGGSRRDRGASEFRLLLLGSASRRQGGGARGDSRALSRSTLRLAASGPSRKLPTASRW